MIFTKKYRTGQIVLTACIAAVCMFSDVHGAEVAGPPAPKSKSALTQKPEATPMPEATPIPASTPTPEQETETDKQNPADQGTLSKPDHPDTISADKLVFIGDSSGIERISPEYYEAATIDGATKPAQFRYMTLPLLKGVFKTNITMWSVSSVGFFVWSQLFSTVTADTQTITPYVYMYMQIFGGGNTVTERNAGLGAAIGVLLSVCVVIVFTICNRVIKDDDLEF